MDWTSKDTIEVIYRLLSVKGVGTVQSNRMLFAVQEKVGTAGELESVLRHQLTEDQQRQFDTYYSLRQHTPDVSYMAVPAPGGDTNLSPVTGDTFGDTNLSPVTTVPCHELFG